MSEMIERVAKSISEKSQVRAYGRIMTPWRDPSMADTYIENRLDEARAAIEAMRDYRGEVEEALDRVPGGWGRGAWLEGINAALGVQS